MWMHCLPVQNWDGSGGNGAALRHFEATGSKYPLVVKLGTITPHGADVFSYAPDENDMVEDPKLVSWPAQNPVIHGFVEKSRGPKLITFTTLATSTHLQANLTLTLQGRMFLNKTSSRCCWKVALLPQNTMQCNVGEHVCRQSICHTGAST